MALAITELEDEALILGYYQPRPEHDVGQPRMFGADRSVRMVENIYPQEAPEPPRRGDTPARAAKQQVFFGFNIAGIQAVMQDFFHYGKRFVPVQRQQLSGSQLPWEERSNIARNPAVAYGSLFLLDPEQYYTLT